MSLGESVLKNPLDNLDDVDVNGENGAPTEKVDSHYEPNDNHRTVSVSSPRLIRAILSFLSLLFLSHFPLTLVMSIQNRTEEINVDLDSDNSILVDISDALSERDKVPFTSSLKDYE